MRTNGASRSNTPQRQGRLTTGELLTLRLALINHILHDNEGFPTPRDRLMNHENISALYQISNALPEDV
jgi:hypothetical protein